MKPHLTLALLLAPLAFSCGQATARAQEVQSAQEAAAQKARPSLQIEARVDEGRWRRAQGLDLRADQRLRLRVQAKHSPQATLRWYLVFPDLSRPYNNANPPGTAQAYQWRGIDPIDYYRVELPQLRDKWEVEPLTQAGDLHQAIPAWLKGRDLEGASMFYHDKAGTFRFQAVLEDGDKISRSPGVEDRDRLGISKEVLRVSVRPDDSFLGYLQSWFNVPGVFGSTTPQGQRFLGVDCADVLMAAYGKKRGRKPRKNYNVEMLVHDARAVASVKLEGGEPQGEAPAWGDSLRAGDFIAVKYEGGSRYQHIGALQGDTDRDGVLSAKDIVLHAGPWPLHPSRLESGYFDGEVVIFRPKASW